MEKRKEKISLFKKAVDTFGADLQSLVTCEELSEVIQAISKMQRFKSDLKNKKSPIITKEEYEEFSKLRLHILEEIVDSEIMFLQLFEIYQFTKEEKEAIARRKIAKLKGKLDA